MVHHRLEERAVVADEEHRRVEAAQVLLEPARGLEIEVVGGLVEQEHVGRRHELLGQAQPAALAAAQARQGPGARLVGIEAESMQHRVDPGGEGVAALAIEPLEIAVVPGQHLRACSGRPPRPAPSACSASDRSSASSSANAPAAASQTVSAPAKSRCCSMTETAQPARPGDGARAGLGFTGDQAEQRRLARAVPPDDAPPLAPGHGERDVAESSRVAPNSTATPASASWVTGRSTRARSASASPTVSCCRSRTSGIRSSKRLLDELVEPAIVAQPRRAETEIGEPAGFAVHQRRHAELLREPSELAGRGRALLQVHEMGLDAPLGEEAERFPGLGTLADAEDLDFHGAGIYTRRRSPTRRRPVPSWITFWPNSTLPSRGG